MMTANADQITLADKKVSNIVKIAYFAFAAGPFTAGLGTVIGFLIAVLSVDETANDLYESHLRYLINTAWTGLFILVIGGLLLFMLVGVPVLVAGFIWYVYRIVRGGLRLNAGLSIRG